MQTTGIGCPVSALISMLLNMHVTMVRAPYSGPRYHSNVQANLNRNLNWFVKSMHVSVKLWWSHVGFMSVINQYDGMPIEPLHARMLDQRDQRHYCCDGWSTWRAFDCRLWGQTQLGKLDARYEVTWWTDWYAISFYGRCHFDKSAMHYMMILVMIFPINRWYIVKICLCYWWVSIRSNSWCFV